MKTQTKHQAKTTTTLLLQLVLVSLALLPAARAVSPAPDGSYPGANTAEGNAALFSLTTGGNNTALGSQALYSVTSGNQNTATGAQALKNNVADQNTADGFQALVNNTSGGGNTATGWRALFQNKAGISNTAVGGGALYNNTSGGGNAAVGNSALFSNIGGIFNTAIGASALSASTGNGNLALGTFAGEDITTGNDNIEIGNEGNSVDDETIRIGTTQTATYIAGINGFDETEGGAFPASAVYVASTGRLGTTAPPSSRRFKKDITPMDKTSAAILALKPVTFKYKNDAKAVTQFGLVAEEVAEVNPDLVARDNKGEIYTVRYDAVNAMLLNEFLKEHHKVQELEKQVKVLTAGLRKVSKQVEASRPVSRIASND